MSISLFAQNFFNHPHSLWMIMLGLIILSYILEDLALITAAALSAEHIIPPQWSLLAVFLGITSGDVFLYFFGRLSRRIRFLRYKAIRNKKFKAFRKRFRKHAFVGLFIIRFIPGLRSIGYTMSGFISIPTLIFLGPVIIASAIWTSLVFGAIYYIGIAILVRYSWMKWALIPLILISFIGFKLIMKKRNSKSS
ncbi:MAG: VTT domain-containing protein [Psittacicella sp.]